MNAARQALRSKLAWLRFEPIDVSTEQGRSAERYRLAAWAAIANVAARVGSMIVMVLAVSMTVGYLGSERFGAWAVLASLVSMLSFLDLGVANALINRVAHAAANDDRNELRRVVSGGLFVLAVLGTTAGLLLATAGALVPWGRLMRLTDPNVAAEVAHAAQVLGVLFGINLFSGGCLKVLVGQQRAHEAHMLSLLGAVLSVAGIWVAANRHAGIPALLVAGFGVQASIGLLALPILARRGLMSGTGAGLLAAILSEGRPLMRTGGVFLMLQIGTMIGWGGDSLILASVRGAGEVAAFAIAQRMFQLASQPVVVLNGPLWAAYADAVARGDKPFLRRTLAHSLGLSIGIAAVISLLLVMLSPWIIPAWTDHKIAVPLQLLLAFAVWTTLEAAGTAFGTYLNGAGVLNQQIAVVVAFCSVALPLKFFGAYQWGAAGLVVATTISYALTVLLMYSTFLRSTVLQPLQDTGR